MVKCENYKIIKVSTDGNFGIYAMHIRGIAKLLVDAFQIKINGKRNKQKQIIDRMHFLVNRDEYKNVICYAAMIGKQVIGYAEVHHHPKWMEVENLAVKDECQRVGIARSFFDTINDDNQQYDEISLKTYGKNVAIYKKLGFIVDAYFYDKQITFIECCKHVPIKICRDPAKLEDYANGLNMDDGKDEGECDEDLGDKEVVTYKCRIYWMKRPIKHKS